MIIVLFHVLYLFGQYIYKNYRIKKLRALCDAAKETELSTEQRIYDKLDDSSSNHTDDEKPSPSKCQEKANLKFNPPAYIQRYTAVLNVLDHPLYKGKIRKVVDFGCAEMNILRCLKNKEGVEEILCVDIDREVLERNKGKAEPYLMEYVCCRKTPLVIELCEGSVTHNDRKLEQTDAVICIELIEHLYPDTLADLPFNIFEYIKPKVVIVTTPNADFNVLFPNFSGFRHPDHKFEWTREQFQNWAQNIVMKYPSYSVTFHGICKGPAGTEELGACSQMAVFHQYTLTEECNKTIGVDGLFKTVARYDYPVHIDNRSEEEKLLHEATYHIFKLVYAQENQDEVILSDILPYLEEKNFNVTIEELKKILVDANWVVKDGEDGLVVKMNPSDSDNYEEDEKFDDDDLNEETELNNEYKLPPSEETFANADGQELPERNSYIEEDWNEEPSIIIPENRSFNQENTYLFDGENFSSENQLSEEFQVTDNNDIKHQKISNITESLMYTDITESLIYTDQELPSNSTFLSSNKAEIDGITEMIKSNTDMLSVSSIDSTISNSGLELQNSSVDNTKIDSTLSENSDINLTSAELQVQKSTMFNFQPYMSVSRSSTSPEPLFFSFQSNNSLHNYSANDQNGSYDKFHQLNCTFNQSEISNEVTMNEEESTAEDDLTLPTKKSFLKKDYKQKSEINSSPKASIKTSTNIIEQSCHELKKLMPAVNRKHMSLNYSKVKDSCNFEQVTSVKNQVFENDIADMVPLNICSSNVNHQPRFTSSPKASTKTSTNITEHSCLDLKGVMPAVNRNILSCIKEAIKETESDIDSSLLKDISEKSSSCTTAETAKLCASSSSDDIANTSKNNVDLCLVSNNAQQDLCLETKEFTKVVESADEGTDEKFMKRNVVINRESDFADDVQNVEAHYSLSNNDNIKHKEENTCTLTKTSDDDTKVHQEDVTDDFAQSNLRKKSLNPPKELESSFKLQNSECSSTECAKKISVLENDRLVSNRSNKDINNVQFVSVLKKNDEIVGTSKDVNTPNIIGLVNNIEAKSVSPFETPPNSWSPEIMDSGYPNSASVQDITPEYDLSSIAQDQIPDSESPSVAEAPRVGILEPIEVENGDLANNNRDDEGNNMMAVDANDIENLQPFINVLEHDLENENDIYVMENGFPIWLLRLLDMANPLDFDMQGRQNLRDPEDEVADDAIYVGCDEGFDSSSSENESDV